MATVARKLNPSVAGAYAQQTPVTMTFSGTGALSTLNLKQPNTTVALPRLWKTALAATLCGAAFSQTGLAQVTTPYQVNFRVPPGTAKGPASIQVSAAWISGAAVNIPVQ